MRFTGSRRVRTAFGLGALAVAQIALGGDARAQGSGTRAQRLFDEGRVLDTRGAHDEACARFAESEALEAAVGTLLNLATCADRRGATATAWRRYREAAALGARQSDPTREAAARRSMSEIEKRLSRLVLTPPAGGLPAGAALTRDGEAVLAQDYGAAVPVDPGTHVVAISAPGYRPWSARVDVGSGPLVVAIPLPELVPTPGAATTPGAPSDSDQRTTDAETGATNDRAPAGSGADGSGTPGKKTAAYVVGAAGLVAVGVGAYFALRARSVWSDVTSQCPDGRCPDATTAASLTPRQEDAARAGDVATIALVGGGVAIAAGIVLYVLSPRASSSTATAWPGSAPASRWTVAGDAGTRGGRVLATMRFE